MATTDQLQSRVHLYMSNSNGGVSRRPSLTEKLETAGYDFEFENKIQIKRFECPICLLICRKTWQTSCGHRFCMKCIQKWMRINTNPKCPVCVKEIEVEKVFPDVCADREIMQLLVFCPNHASGCRKALSLDQIEKHTKNCEFSSIVCPNGCDIKVIQGLLEEHLATECVKRETTCNHCGEKLPYEGMQLHEESGCMQIVVPCYYCEESDIRANLPSHHNVCPKYQLKCTFQPLGCNFTLPRNEMAKHEQDFLQQHVKQLAIAMIEWMAPVKKLIRSSEENVAEMPCISSHCTQDLAEDSGVCNTEPSDSSLLSSFSSTVPELTPEFEISLYQQMSERHSHQSPECSEIYTCPQITMTDKQAATVSGYASGHVCNLYEHFGKDVQGSCERLTIPCKTGSMPSLKTLSISDSNLSLQSEVNSLSKKCELQGSVIRSLKKKCGSLTQELSQNKLQIKKFENTIHNMQYKMCGGILMWKITNYSKILSDAIQGIGSVRHSPGFYTSIDGYHLCLRLHPNGIGVAVGSYMSVFVHFLKGENDDILEWPFKGNITISILDQSDNGDKQHVVGTLKSDPKIAAFKKPTVVRNDKGFGYTEFMHILRLNIDDECNSRYIKNDTLIIKIHAKVS